MKNKVMLETESPPQNKKS